jgi:hypothetical protein
MHPLIGANSVELRPASNAPMRAGLGAINITSRKLAVCIWASMAVEIAKASEKRYKLGSCFGE